MESKKKRSERLNESKLFGFIHNNRRKVRTNSVPVPSAQTNTVLQLQGQQGTELSAVLDREDEFRKYSVELWYMIYLMIVSGCRVSEILAVTPQQILNSGHIVIKASKGSNDRVIHAGEARVFLQKCRREGRVPFCEWDRFRVYRVFKRFGLSERIRGKKNNSVTHLFRQLGSRELQRQGVEKRVVSTVLGHKSDRSIEYYSDDRK